LRIVSSPARWLLSFLVLPALWIGASIVTGMQAGWVIPVAVVVALVSAMIGYHSGPGLSRAVAYFLGTATMMGGRVRDRGRNPLRDLREPGLLTATPSRQECTGRDGSWLGQRSGNDP
jgi:hypothetical protein